MNDTLIVTVFVILDDALARLRASERNDDSAVMIVFPTSRTFASMISPPRDPLHRKRGDLHERRNRTTLLRISIRHYPMTGSRVLR